MDKSIIINPETDFKIRLEKALHTNLSKCYQCGKCTAGCPLAKEMDIKPHQIIRLINLGDYPSVLTSSAIWLCLGCETCTTRCPKEIDIAEVMDYARQSARASNAEIREKAIVRFNDVFLLLIKLGGKLYEVGLVGGYNTLSMNPIKDIDVVPSMLAKGKLNFIPHRIGNFGEFEKMVKKCEKYAREESEGKG